MADTNKSTPILNAAKLLPIGSVVLVKEAEKKLMIIGIIQKNSDTQYDYSAVLYPEGYVDAEHFYMFNHADIEKIEYLGFINAEHQYFRKNLVDMMSGEGSDFA